MKVHQVLISDRKKNGELFNSPHLHSSTITNLFLPGITNIKS
jgi:hypothetical protein